MAGRPRKVLTDEQRGELETLAALLNQDQIADYFGMGRTTFYEMMERDADISERYKRGKAKAIGSVARGLLQKARDGDTASAIFYLKTQAGWKETDKHIVSGDPDNPVQLRVTHTVDPKDIESAIAKLKGL
jgi:hypothetical protein